MKVVSEFEDFYLLRPALLPIICLGLSLLFLTQEVHEHETNPKLVALFLFIAGAFILIFNFRSVYKLAVDEVKITKIFLISRKTQLVYFTDIQESKLEYVSGMRTKAGFVSLGYYHCKFTLKDGNTFILTPLHFKNYKQIVKAISENRSIA